MPDAESRGWIDRLRGEGSERDEAIAALHALLVRAARFELGRRSATVARLRADVDELAHESANDALIALLRKLDAFRGESRFTTWAYKFALYETAVKVRRMAWRGRELPLPSAGWQRFADAQPGPSQAAETDALLRALRDAIADELTPHQREVLVALALNDVPIDVLAERLETTRGALYKTLHDARRKLRAVLAQRGLPVDARTGGGG
jgi:RNA polymerase sigma-70 factor (ECF subfamily)